MEVRKIIREVIDRIIELIMLVKTKFSRVYLTPLWFLNHIYKLCSRKYKCNINFGASMDIIYASQDGLLSERGLTVSYYLHY